MSSVLVAVCDATRVASGVEPTKVSLSQALNRVKFPDSFTENESENLKKTPAAELYPTRKTLLRSLTANRHPHPRVSP